MPWAAEFLEDAETAEKRYATRRTLRMTAATSRSNDADLASQASSGTPNVLIHNLSTTGLLLETAEQLEEGERFDITLPEIDTAEVIVIWRSGLLYGCEFTTPVSTGVVSATLLRSPTKPLPAHPAPKVFFEALDLPGDAKQEVAKQEVAEQGWLEELPRDGSTLSFRSKALIIIGLDLALWAMIAVLAWALFW